MKDTPVTFAVPRFIADLNDCFFYHTMELPGFGLVHGHWDLRGRFDDYVVGVSVAGKTVLDVATEVLAMLGFAIEKINSSKYLYDYGKRDEERFTLVAVRI